MSVALTSLCPAHKFCYNLVRRALPLGFSFSDLQEYYQTPRNRYNDWKPWQKSSISSTIYLLYLLLFTSLETEEGMIGVQVTN